MRKIIALAVAFGVLASSASYAAPAVPGNPATSGPAWWRVSDADSEVWIIATPEQLPIAVKWDETALKERMTGARMLIVPPPAENNLSVSMKASIQRKMPIPKQALSERLAPAIYERLWKAVPRVVGNMSYSALGVSGDYRTALDREPTIFAADFLSFATLTVDRLGNPVVSRAKVLAAANRGAPTRIRTMETGATNLRALINIIDIPEQLQQACLLQVLYAVEQGTADGESRDQALEAWANGDVVGALKRHHYLVDCPYGPPGEALWARISSDNVKAINEALALPGKSVAVVEFDVLLRRGGVLDLLERQGLRNEDPIR